MKHFFRQYEWRRLEFSWPFKAAYMAWHVEITGIASEDHIDSAHSPETDPHRVAPQFPPEFMCDQVYWYSQYLQDKQQGKLF